MAYHNNIVYYISQQSDDEGGGGNVSCNVSEISTRTHLNSYIDFLAAGSLAISNLQKLIIRGLLSVKFNLKNSLHSIGIKMDVSYC
jgi:hypothetical protein